MKSNRSIIHTIEEESLTLSNWSSHNNEIFGQLKKNAIVQTGWGKLIFAHTYSDQRSIANELMDEQKDERNIAFYAPDPHVIISQAPQDLFLDPSHTFRIWLETYKQKAIHSFGFIVRELKYKKDLDAINQILLCLNMVPFKKEIIWENRNSALQTILVAEEIETSRIIGSVMGIDHRIAFNDPENGSSLWALAVDPFSIQPGIGEALVRSLIQHYLACNRAYLDLSVMHDNKPAIELYKKLGFERIPVFTLKKKNTINEPLYTTDIAETELNPYAMIIINEAKKRGIQVEVVDEEYGLFNLSFGGMQIACRESLTDLTSAVVMNNCDNKRITWKLLRRAGISVPEQVVADTGEKNREFLEKHGAIVVKPARGEQGKGVFVDIRTPEEMENAIAEASNFCEQVILEQLVRGEDLRLVLINYKIVAAAIRQRPFIIGDGKRTIRELIEKQSKRRSSQTGGESRIPLDAETERCVTAGGYCFDDVLPTSTELQVRKTANLHTGGKLIDVTDDLDAKIIEAAEKAAEVLRIPVVGLDFIVPKEMDGSYHFIEANERPGLANHEPRPTAERFIDLLFPRSASSV